MQKKEIKEDLTDIEINGGGDSSKNYTKKSNIALWLLVGVAVLTILIIVLCK